MAKTITLNRRLIERMLRQQFNADDFLYAHTSILNEARLFHDRAEESMKYALELSERKARREYESAAYRKGLIRSLIEARTMLHSSSGLSVFTRARA